MALLSKRKSIALNKVLSGMILEFNYTKVNGERKDYTVLVVDPNLQNEHAREPQLHGYVIDELDDDTLIEFMDAFTAEIQIGTNKERQQILIEELNTDEAYLYFLTSQFAEERRYRTFNLSRIGSVKQVLIGPL